MIHPWLNIMAKITRKNLETYDQVYDCYSNHQGQK
jgi:hypothetical protein